MNDSIIHTILGTLRIIDDGLEVQSIQFLNEDEQSSLISEIAMDFKEQIDEYATQKRRNFNISFSIEGTPFQRDVLIAMSSIPYGKTMSYQELARKAGYPNAQRAVGSVCRKNIFPFLLPCHRVINSNGDIGKYSGSEDFKGKLINLEKQR